MSQQYNNPTGGSPSTVGTQFETHYYERKALIEAQRDMFFGQLANMTSMPKNMGKEIKRYHYLPILDDQNINDQGIDANGVTISKDTYVLRFTSLVQVLVDGAAATAAANAINAVQAGVASAAGSTVTLTQAVLLPTTLVLANAVVGATPYVTMTRQSGNLYGSSKDIGLIPSKIPMIGENSGKVNGVGITRKDIIGTFENYGFHTSYTADSLHFDTDSELMTHTNRELMNAAMKITEDALQIDLINNAGVIRYTGVAINNTTLTEASTLTYKDLMQLSIDLDNNRCPKQTTIITGTRNVDTKVIPACRVAYCGSELIPTLEAMVDLHGAKAFVPVEMYAAGTTVLTGERGRIGDFRFIIVIDMVKFAGQGGASVSGSFYDTGGKLDVFPILVVGEDSFTTIGFNTDGKSSKFKTKHMKPDELYSLDNPFGKKGFMSIEWYYGFMLLRGERLALIKTVGVM